MLIYDQKGLSQSNKEINAIYFLLTYRKHLRDVIVYRLSVEVKYCSYSRETEVRLPDMSVMFFTVHCTSVYSAQIQYILYILNNFLLKTTKGTRDIATPSGEL